MILLVVFKAAVVGALLGALLMFISTFAAKSGANTSRTRPFIPNSFSEKFLISIRFFAKLLIFLLMLLIPIILLKIILS